MGNEERERRDRDEVPPVIPVLVRLGLAWVTKLNSVSKTKVKSSHVGLKKKRVKTKPQVLLPSHHVS